MTTNSGRLLHLVFVVARACLVEGDHRRAYHLVDLFHNFPMDLAMLGEAAAFSSLMKKASEKGLQDWLVRWLEDNGVQIVQ